ncbi:MAG: twin-arginine translocase TatA/TatE family subunit [Acidimicrobiales bacterium]
MLFLSPEKLLIVLVVAVIVLGPDKLPKAARHAASLWRTLTSLRTRLETEARSAIPELPSFATITDAMRSPLAYLDRLADGSAERREELSTMETASCEPSRAVLATPEEADRVGAALLADPSLN